MTDFPICGGAWSRMRNPFSVLSLSSIGQRQCLCQSWSVKATVLSTNAARVWGVSVVVRVGLLDDFFRYSGVAEIAHRSIRFVRVI
jgi:hypothetical protein